MWIVKIGGSLTASKHLRAWLAALAGRHDVVVVPGGGPFADQVRRVQRAMGFDNATAHELALLAMEQYGRALCALQPGLTPAASLSEIRALAYCGLTPVWLPYALTMAEPDLPRTWDLTSDSLAGWLGEQLQAQALVLIKVAPLRPGPVALDTLIRNAIVDPLLESFTDSGRLPVYLLGDADAPALDDLLAGRPGRAVIAQGQSPERPAV
ncbi:amino acid kinase [uncultured Thiodictyon sp.]|uniref:amino acid kinase family protein n=1 Tax=uncultured Thiodictyon sp. TaxID=1846217 RepID=UPI0025DEB5DB|nr:amino acid kinase [uncultured Thiodictyon sp.]